MITLFQEAKTDIRILGIMSGTSLDGIDMALVRFSGKDVTPVFSVEHTECLTLPSELRSRIHACFCGSTADVCRLHRDLGFFFAECVTLFCDNAGVKPDAVACHGQTVWHIHGHSSLQIGDADCIAKHTGLPVFFDFRAGDIAVGGSGAPLVPIFDRLLAIRLDVPVIFQNLGGIGNVTYIDGETISAFDTGPANMVADLIVRFITKGKQTYDNNGQLAASGAVQQDVLSNLLSHPFLAKKPPKSTGHEDFGAAFVKELLETYSHISPVDVLRTVFRFTAELTVAAYRKYCPGARTVYLTGGGALNPVLLNDFKELLVDRKLGDFSGDFGFDPDYKEAVAFAYLGYCRYHAISSNSRTVTNSSRHVSLGKLAFPD